MRLLSRFPAIVGALLLVLSAATTIPSARADEADAARQAVVQVADEAVRTFGGKTMTPEERIAKLKGLIEKYGDMRVSAQDILGRYWSKASPDQQSEFTALVLDYAVGSWSSHLDDVPTGQHLEVTATEQVGEGRILVHSQLIGPSDSDPVDWTVASRPQGGPAIVDVSADGVSIIQTMKADFTAIVRANGGRIDPLLEALRKKIASYQAVK